MPETETLPEAPADGTTPDGATPPVEHDAPLGESGKRALEAERTARKAAEKAAADAQERIRAFEAERLTELEKAQLLAKESAETAAKATAEALRWRLAAEHGISAEDSVLLTGADETTLTAQAQRIAALRAGAIPPQPRTPSPDPSQGARTGPGDLSEDETTYRSLYGDLTS